MEKIKKDKWLIRMLESVLLWDFSDALQDKVYDCLKVYKWITTYEELEVFYEQYEGLINICRLYTM